MPRIEPFVPDDLPAFRRMLHEYLLEHDPDSTPSAYWNDEFFTACLDGIAAGTHLIWLARIDVDPIGFAVARIEQHWYRRAIRIGIIEEFFVASPHRRTGIGQALALYTISSLRRAGAVTITASVLQANLGALLFWQRVGFTIEAYHLFLRAR